MTRAGLERGNQRMLSQLLPTVLMLQLPNLAFFDNLYTLSNSKAKLRSSAVSFCTNSATADHSFIIAHPWQRQDQNQNGNQNLKC
jgi:hypothetical protein